MRRPCGGRHTKESRGTTEAGVGATGLHAKGRLEEAGGPPSSRGDEESAALLTRRVQTSPPGL